MWLIQLVFNRQLLNYPFLRGCRAVEGDRVHEVGVARECAEKLASGLVPEFDGFVAGAAGKEVVGAEGDRQNRATVIGQSSYMVVV